MPRVSTKSCRLRHCLPAVIAGVAALLLSSGGLRAQAAIPGDTATVSISGIVFDSLSGQPLAGALVQMVGEGAQGKVLSARTDSSGAFHLSAVPSGQYQVGFMHPALDSLGLALQPKTIRVAASLPRNVTLAIPGSVSMHNRLCPPAPASDSSGALIGFVRDADSGAPITNGSVVATWVELISDQHGIRVQRRRVPAEADSTGWYMLCGAPSGSAIAAKGQSDASSSGYVNVVVPAHGLVHVDFSVPSGRAVALGNGMSAGPMGGQPRTGSARLTGVVRDSAGHPIDGVQLRVWGSAVSGNTDQQGAFTLSGLPAGTQTLEARHVGFLARRETVNLTSNQSTSVTIAMHARADVLNAVTVFGNKTRRAQDNTGFLERRKLGMGYFLTKAQIEQRNALTFTDLMRSAPGLTVYPTGGLGYQIISTRNRDCSPQIYIDGALIQSADAASMIDDLVSPGEISGVEVYDGSLDTPPQFHGARATCGSIVIWTKPALADAQRK